MLGSWFLEHLANSRVFIEMFFRNVLRFELMKRLWHL